MRVLDGERCGQITHRIQVYRRAIACEFGSEDGRTLDDLTHGKWLGSRHHAQIDIPGAAWK